MIRGNGRLVKPLSKCAQSAAEMIQNNFDDKADEEAVSDQFLGAFKTRIRSKNFPEVTVSAETTTHRGKNPVEARTGADMAIKFIYDISNYHYESGILLQAKYHQKYDRDIDKLRQTCGKMLSHTASSYLITYSPTSFCHFPANAIHGIEEELHPEFSSRNIGKLIPYRETKKFYKRFFRGIIGDRIIPRNWDYLMDNSNSFNRRADPRSTFKSDGGEEIIEEDERANGLKIVVTDDN